jgi:hypothetical protein
MLLVVHCLVFDGGVRLCLVLPVLPLIFDWALSEKVKSQGFHSTYI